MPRRAAEAKEALGAFVMALEVAPFSDTAARAYGQVRAALARQGTPIGPIDTLIGSHALEIDAVLVTHNTREFSGIDGLRLEDWVS